MKRAVLLLLLTVSPLCIAGEGLRASNTINDLQVRCLPASSTQEILYSDDFHWNMGFQEMLDIFKTIYASPKRLDRRAYFDKTSQILKLPYDAASGGDVELPLSFVKTVQIHIERALENKYADAVIFPDLGHSHYLIPNEKYKKLYQNIPNEETSRMYTLFFKDPDIKVAYHTAEQLQTMKNNTELQEDSYLQWRHFTRNLIGDNFGSRNVVVAYAKDQSTANTLGSLEGYRWWGAGFNLSANKDGCFQYFNKRDGQIYGFDISLYDLISNPANGVSSDQ